MLRNHKKNSSKNDHLHSSHNLSFPLLYFLIINLLTYISGINAQTAAAKRIDVTKLTPEEGITLTGGSGIVESIFIGDFNNDGHNDTLIGMPEADEVFLPFWPYSETNLNNLSGATGRRFKGALGTGFHVFGAYVNNDTFLDIIISALTSNTSYLQFGPTFEVTDLRTLSGSKGRVFTGGLYFGVGAAVADLNNDGNNDLIYGSYGGVNKIYGIYGPDFLETNAENLNSTTGIVFTGGSAIGATIGVAYMNNDSYIDFVTGAPGEGTISEVYGPFKKTNLSNLINGQDGYIFTTHSPTTGFDLILRDANKDNRMDFFTCDWPQSKIYIKYGAEKYTNTNLDASNDPEVVVMTGAQDTGHYLSVADSNNDGNVDMLTCAFRSEIIYLRYGPNFSAVKNLALMSLLDGVIFFGVKSRANALADLSGDNYPEVIIGGNAAVYAVYNEVFNEHPPTTTPAATLALPTETKTTTALITAALTSAILTTSNTVATMAITSLLPNPGTSTLHSSLGLTSAGNTAENNNSATYIGIGVGVGVVGVLVGVVGFFAFNKCRNKKSRSEEHSMHDMDAKPKKVENIYDAPNLPAYLVDSAEPFPQGTGVRKKKDAKIVYDTFEEVSLKDTKDEKIIYTGLGVARV